MCSLGFIKRHHLKRKQFTSVEPTFANRLKPFVAVLNSVIKVILTFLVSLEFRESLCVSWDAKMGLSSRELWWYIARRFSTLGTISIFNLSSVDFLVDFFQVRNIFWRYAGRTKLEHLFLVCFAQIALDRLFVIVPCGLFDVAQLSYLIKTIRASTYNRLWYYAWKHSLSTNWKS